MYLTKFVGSGYIPRCRYRGTTLRNIFQLSSSVPTNVPYFPYSEYIAQPTWIRSQVSAPIQHATQPAWIWSQVSTPIQHATYPRVKIPVAIYNWQFVYTVRKINMRKQTMRGLQESSPVSTINKGKFSISI
jgi:hypothetical protein